MKKLSVLILAAAALFAGCNNLTVEKNKDSKKLNNLEVISYKDYPIYYFFVINKKSSLFTTKFDENNFITDILFKRLQDIIDSNSISKIIEQK